MTHVIPMLQAELMGNISPRLERLANLASLMRSQLVHFQADPFGE